MTPTITIVMPRTGNASSRAEPAPRKNSGTERKNKAERIPVSRLVILPNANTRPVAANAHQGAMARINPGKSADS